MKINKKQICIAGYYGYGNLGDELILSALISDLKKRYTNPSIYVLSGNPSETAKTHQVFSISRWNPFRIIFRLAKSDLFILGGGGLLQDNTSRRSLFYYLALIKLAHWTTGSIFLYAVGVDAIKNFILKRLTKWVLSPESIVISVRDQESRHALIKIGLLDSRIHVVRDPVFRKRPPTRVKERFAEYSKSALMIPRLPCPESGYRVFEILKNFFEGQRNYQVNATFFQPKFESQSLFASGVAPIFSPDQVYNSQSSDEIITLIGYSDFVVSARFHGLVMAALAGKPFLGVGDPDKVGRFCRAWGMPFISWKASTREILVAGSILCSISPNPKRHDLGSYMEEAQSIIDLAPASS